MNTFYVVLFIFSMMNKKSEALFNLKCLLLQYFAVLLCACALMLCCSSLTNTQSRYVNL